MKLCRVAVAALVCLLVFPVVVNVPGNVSASYDLSQVAYYDLVKQALNLTSAQEEMLEQYGFTTVQFAQGQGTDEPAFFSPWQRFEDFYYEQVYGPDLPVFVTTDSILHLFHVVFDCSLRTVEYQTFYPMIFDVTQYAFQTALDDYAMSVPHDGSVTYWAVRNATVYFAVAMSLVSGETADVPSELQADLNFYLNQIYAEEPEFITVANWEYPVDVIEVKYDFTQFTVRGHYVGIPRLEQYFRTMTWYGQFPTFIPREDETYQYFLSHIDDAAMVYARDILKRNPLYYDKWMTLYNVTSVLVGESDSINPVNLEIALRNVFGDRDSYLAVVAASGGLTALRTELAKPEYAQQILGQAILSNMGVKVRYPIVYQFMGQRYVPDSFIFQMLCWDNTGYNTAMRRRIMPKGLDVFAVLGSERAYHLLASDYDYENFTDNFAILQSKFDNMTEEEWEHSSYTAWIYSLQSLTNVEYDDSYPEFMRNLAWQDEKLNTACGSWAQLRHDTLLYAKQTYIPGVLCSYPEAFVEPNPTFYSRMQKLTERTIEAFNMLPTNSATPISPYYPETIVMDSLETIQEIVQKLETISIKELAQEPLSTEEVEFIKEIVHGCGSGGFIGWYVDTITDIAAAANYTAILDVPLIADVATFPPDDIYDPPQILHVGVGYVNALVVLYPMANGTLVAAVGPVFSYYEFPLIGTTRLNDDDWKTMLTWSNSSEYLPDWFKDVYAMSAPYPFVPEQITAVALIAIIGLSSVAIVYLKKLGGTKKTRLRT